MSTRPTSKGEVTLSDTFGGRHYIIDEVKYVSTTTPLSILSMPAINEWKMRVGKTKAGLIAGKASKYGTRIHDYAADILEGKLDEKERSDMSADGYECANWAYKMADSQGYKRALAEIISLITEK